MTMQGRLYHSYLVRLWGEIRQGRVVWRAALEHVQSGEQRQFARLDELFALIETDLQTEGSMIGVVFSATIREGRVNELLILWRTSVALALQRTTDLSYTALLVDQAKHRMLLMAGYSTRAAADSAWASDRWGSTIAPLAQLLLMGSVNIEVYDRVDIR